MIVSPELLKKTFTRIFLSNNNSNWVKQLDEVVDNFNKMPNSAIKNITPHDAFKEKNHRTIYDINYEKSLKNNSTVLDIDVNDKVRILTKKQFQKGTESRYSDTVYTVKKINGNSITLNNDEVYKRTSLWEITIFLQTFFGNFPIFPNSLEKFGKIG